MRKRNFVTANLVASFQKGLKWVMSFSSVIRSTLYDLGQYPGLGILTWVAKRIDRGQRIVKDLQLRADLQKRRRQETLAKVKKVLRSK
jgi:hypothetical protein